jgi:RecB family exonuclease
MKDEDPREAMLASFKETAVSEDYKGKIEKFLEEIKPWLKHAVYTYEEQKFQPLATEEKVSFRYRNIIMTGRVDRIDHVGPGTVKIVDYKSSKNPDYLTPTQLGIYHIGVKYGSLSDVYGKKGVETAYVLLRHDMKETPYTFTVEQLEDILDQIEEVSEQIQTDTEWEPKPSKLCQYCDFFVPCTQERSEIDEWW